MINLLNYLSVREYLPELEKAKHRKERMLQEVKDESMNRLLKDLAIDRAKNSHGPLDERWEEEEEEEEDDTDTGIVDRSKQSVVGRVNWLIYSTDGR